MNELYKWFHDDISWWGNECFYTQCERNIANRLSKTGPYSVSMFKGTEMCPLFEKENKNGNISCENE